MKGENVKFKFLKGPEKKAHYVPGPSPWPILASWFAFQMLFSAVMVFHKGWSFLWVGISLLSLSACLGGWWRDVLRESVDMRVFTFSSARIFRTAMVLFIASEVMFFFAFFWAFFHSSLAPVIQIGCVWPPIGVECIDPWGVPLLNTAVLLSSGGFVTYSHNLWKDLEHDPGYETLVVLMMMLLASSKVALERQADVKGSTELLTVRLNSMRKKAAWVMAMTCFLGAFFTWLQFMEYKAASFTVADGIYGSTFFLTTGFHGLHVLIGTVFLLVCCWRMAANRFNNYDHFGLEAGIWYWHFVDVVWLVVFTFIYVWGSA